MRTLTSQLAVHLLWIVAAGVGLAWLRDQLTPPRSRIHGGPPAMPPERLQPVPPPIERRAKPRDNIAVDFAQMLNDMAYLLGAEIPGTERREPVGTRFLAVYLGVSRGMVRNWFDGTLPDHPEGERIIAEWMRLTGKPRAFVPTTRLVLSAHRA